MHNYRSGKINLLILQWKSLFCLEERNFRLSDSIQIFEGKQNGREIKFMLPIPGDKNQEKLEEIIGIQACEMNSFEKSELSVLLV